MRDELEQLKIISKLLLELLAESEHTNFVNMQYHYDELQEINNLSTKYLFWIDDKIKELEGELNDN